MTAFCIHEAKYFSECSMYVILKDNLNEKKAVIPCETAIKRVAGGFV